MHVKLNGEQQVIQETMSLQDALNMWGYHEPQNFAVGVNGTFVARGEYKKLKLKEADEVDVVTMVQGG